MTGTQFYRNGRTASDRRSLSNIGQDLSSLTSLYQKFWLSTFDLGANLFDDTVQLMGSTEPSRTILRAMKPRRLCEVPLASHPDPFLGEIVREAYVGESIRVPLRVKNRTRKTRVFQFAAEQPLKNVQGEEGGALKLDTTQYTLVSLETRVLNATLDVSSESFKPGFDYKTKIVITSEKCEPQILGFTLRVLSEDAAPLIKLSCLCHPPVRQIHWYDHFYCDVQEDDDCTGEPQSSCNEHEDESPQ